MGTRVERRLAAILAADVAGFSALMERDEEGTYVRIENLRREVIQPQVSQHLGRLIKTTGDGFLVEFASPITALRCALAVQATLASDPLGLPLRIGLNLGDVIIEESGDVYGEGVNVAARLEGIAGSGEILISAKFYDEVAGKVEAAFEDRGEQQVKNISRPVRVFAARSTGTLVSTKLGRTPPLSDTPSIAVLPFSNMSNEPEQEYFADGITEDIITELSRFKGLLVIARNSTFTYKNQAVDVKKVAAQLGVKYVLEGSVRRSGARVRVTAQLIEAQTGGHVWAERYDRELLDIFDLQDEITRTVVATLQTEMILREGNLAGRMTVRDLDVWSTSKKAWKQFYNLTRDSLTDARALAATLVNSEPNSPEGYKLQSAIISHYVYMGFSKQPASDIEEARRAVRTALRLEENDEHSNWALGIILGFFDHKYSDAEAALKRSIEINPNFSLGYGTLGTILAYAGRAEESIGKSQYAIRLNPRDPSIFFRYNSLAIAYFILQNYEQSFKWAQLSIDRKPDFWVSQSLLTASLSMLGRNEEARSSRNDLIKQTPGISLHSLPIDPIRPPIAKKLFYEALLRAGVPE